MWKAVVIAAALGVAGASYDELEKPAASAPDVPREPPQLPPLDDSDDVFQPGFVADPNSQFIFAARTERLNSRPQLLETTGNIVAYIKRRTSTFANRATKEPEKTVRSTTSRVLLSGASSPSPLPIPRTFDFIEGKSQLQPTKVRDDYGHTKKPSFTTLLKEDDPLLLENRLPRKHQNAVAPNLRSRGPTRGAALTDTDALERNLSRFNPSWIRTELSEQLVNSVTADKEEMHSIRPTPIKPVVEPGVSKQEDEVLTTVTSARAISRRKLAKRKHTTAVDGESNQMEESETAARVTKPPPPPVPTLSPWIDGYGK